jgi:acyl carrier protein
MDATKSILKSYILEEFLPGEDPALLTDETPLVSGGILDSLATLRLVTFLEERFGVSIEPHEMSMEYMNTLPDLANLVESKR